MADRSMTSEMEVAITEEHTMPAIFAELQFLTTPVRFWNGFTELDWNGFTWSGKGSFTGIEGVEENTDGTSQEVILSLSGLDKDLVAAAYADVYQGRQAKVWLGLQQLIAGYGVDRVLNGTFDTDDSNWTKATASDLTVTIVSGQAVVQNTHATNSNGIYQDIYIPPGKDFRLDFAQISFTGTGGTTIYDDHDFNNVIYSNASPDPTGTQVINSVSGRIRIYLKVDALSTITYDNIVARPLIINRDTEIIPDPVLYMQGIMSSLGDVVDEGGQDAVLSLKVTSQSLNQRSPRRWRLTPEHQEELYPGDTGLRWVTNLAQQDIQFGG